MPENSIGNDSLGLKAGHDRLLINFTGTGAQLAVVAEATSKTRHPET
jgi:hypothetical protein